MTFKINGKEYEVVASYPSDGSMGVAGLVVRVLRNVQTGELIVETETSSAMDAVYHRIGNGGCTPVDQSSL